jgi:hypothetical protein
MKTALFPITGLEGLRCYADTPLNPFVESVGSPTDNTHWNDRVFRRNFWSQRGAAALPEYSRKWRVERQ